MSQRVWFDFDGDIDCVRGDFEYIADVKQAIHRKLGKSVTKSPLDIRLFYAETSSSHQLIELRGDVLCKNPETGYDIISGTSPVRSLSRNGEQTQQAKIIVVIQPHNNLPTNGGGGRPISPVPGNRSQLEQHTPAKNINNNNNGDFYIPPRSATPTHSSGKLVAVPPSTSQTPGDVAPRNSSNAAYFSSPSGQQQQENSNNNTVIVPLPVLSSTGNPRASQLFARQQQKIHEEPKIRLGVDIVAASNTEKVIGTVFVDLAAHLLRPAARTASPDRASPAQQNRRNDGARIRTILDQVRDAVSKHVVAIETPSLPPNIVRILAYDAEFSEFVLLTENSNAHISQSFDSDSLTPSRAMIAVVDYPVQSENNGGAGFIVTRNTPARVETPPIVVPQKQQATAVRSRSPPSPAQQQINSLQDAAMRSGVLVVHAPSGSTVQVSPTHHQPQPRSSQQQQQSSRPGTAPARPSTTTSAATQQSREIEVSSSASALADKLEIVMQQLQDERQRRNVAERVIAERESSIGEQLAAARREGAEAARQGQSARLEYLNNQFLATQHELEGVRRELKQAHENAIPTAAATSFSASTPLELQRELTLLRRTRAEQEAEIDILKSKRNMLEEQLSHAAGHHEAMIQEVDALRLQVTNLVLDKNRLEDDLDQERRRPHSSAENVAFDEKVSELERTLEESCATFAQQVADLQKQLDEERQHRNIAEHKAQNITKDLETYRSSWGKEVTDKTQRIAELQAKLDAIDATRDKDSDALLKSKAESEELRKQLEHAKLQVHQLSNQVAEEREKNQKMTEQVENAEKIENAAVEKVLTEKNAEIEKLLSENQELQQKSRELASAAAPVLSEQDKIVIAEQREEIRKLKQLLDQQRTTEETLRNEMKRDKETQSAEKKELVLKLAQAQERELKLQTQLEEANNKNRSLSLNGAAPTTAQTNNNNNDEEQQKLLLLQQKDAELMSAKQSVSTLEADVERLKEQLEAAQKELETMKTLAEMDDAPGASAAPSHEKSATLRERSMSPEDQQKLKELEESRQQYLAEVKRLQESLNAQNGEVNNLRTQLSEALDNLHGKATFTPESSGSHGKIESEKIKSLESELETVRSQKEKTESEKQDFARQLEELQESFTSIRQRLQTRIDSLTQQLVQAQRENQMKEETVKDLQEDLEEEKAEHENTKRDLMSMSSRRLSRGNSVFRTASGGVDIYGESPGNQTPNHLVERGAGNVSFSFNSPHQNQSSASVVIDPNQFFAVARGNVEKDETIARKETENEEFVAYRLIITDHQSQQIRRGSLNNSSGLAGGSNSASIPLNMTGAQQQQETTANNTNKNNNNEQIAQFMGVEDDDDDDPLGDFESANQSGVIPQAGKSVATVQPEQQTSESEITFGETTPANSSGITTPQLSATSHPVGTKVVAAAAGGVAAGGGSFKVTNTSAKPKAVIASSSAVAAASESGADSELNFGLSTPGPENSSGLQTPQKSQSAVRAESKPKSESELSFGVDEEEENKEDELDTPKQDAPLQSKDNVAAPPPATTKTAEEEELDFGVDDELPTPVTKTLESTIQPEPYQATKQPSPAASGGAAAVVAAAAKKQPSPDNVPDNGSDATFTFDSATVKSDSKKVAVPAPKPAAPPVAVAKPAQNDDDDDEDELNFDLSTDDAPAPVKPPAATTNTAMANVPAPPRSFQIAAAESSDDDFSLDSHSSSRSSSPAKGAFSAKAVQQAIAGAPK